MYKSSLSDDSCSRHSKQITIEMSTIFIFVSTICVHRGSCSINYIDQLTNYRDKLWFFNIYLIIKNIRQLTASTGNIFFRAWATVIGGPVGCRRQFSVPTRINAAVAILGASADVAWSAEKTWRLHTTSVEIGLLQCNRILMVEFGPAMIYGQYFKFQKKSVILLHVHIRYRP